MVGCAVKSGCQAAALLPSGSSRTRNTCDSSGRDYCQWRETANARERNASHLHGQGELNADGEINRAYVIGG